MPYYVVATPLTITSSGSQYTNKVQVDDAPWFTVCISSSVVSTAVWRVDVSPMDGAISSGQQGNITSTFYPLVPNNVTTSHTGSTGGTSISMGTAVTIANTGFRRVQLFSSSGVETSGTVVGWLSRQV